MLSNLQILHHFSWFVFWHRVLWVLTVWTWWVFCTIQVKYLKLQLTIIPSWPGVGVGKETPVHSWPCMFCCMPDTGYIFIIKFLPKFCTVQGWCMPDYFHFLLHWNVCCRWHMNPWTMLVSLAVLLNIWLDVLNSLKVENGVRCEDFKRCDCPIFFPSFDKTIIWAFVACRLCSVCLGRIFILYSTGLMLGFPLYSHLSQPVNPKRRAWATCCDKWFIALDATIQWWCKIL